MHLSASAWIVSCFTAFQVGWFPSTYVEEEEWLFRMNDIYSAAIQSWPPPVRAMLLSCSLCPASQISLIKPRDSDLRGSGSAPKNLLLPSDRLSHRADVKSQIPGAPLHISPFCGLSAPAALWEVHVLCPDNPPSSLPAHLVLLLMTPLAGVRLALTVIMFQYQEGSVTQLEHRSRWQRTPRYSYQI